MERLPVALQAESMWAFVGSILLGPIGEYEGFRALFFAADLSLLTGFGGYKFHVMNNK